MPMLALTLLSFTEEPGPTVMPPFPAPPRLLLWTLLPCTAQPRPHTIPSKKWLLALLSHQGAVDDEDPDPARRSVDHVLHHHLRRHAGEGCDPLIALWTMTFEFVAPGRADRERVTTRRHDAGVVDLVHLSAAQATGAALSRAAAPSAANARDLWSVLRSLPLE